MKIQAPASSKSFCNFLAPALTACLIAASAASAVAGGGGGGRGGGNYPPVAQGDYVIKDFKFKSGETLPEVKMHYRTIGEPKSDENGVVTNAVLILHGTTGTGGQFVTASFANVLFEPGQLLDGQKYYLIMPDNIGHGQSSKPSDGLHAKFPKYGYPDMIVAQYRLLTEGLKVNHTRLVMGTSMGGMHSWLWGSMYPDYMDALMPLAAVPTQMSGRNRMWRRVIIDAITNDPTWGNGDYKTTPASMHTVGQMMTLMADNAVRRARRDNTTALADRDLDNGTRSYMRMDANDTLYAYAASEDYDPAPGLDKIKVPMMAINSADDLINPPEIGSLEAGIAKVKYGTAFVIPLSDRTVGHGTHTMAAIWKDYLAALLDASAKGNPPEKPKPPVEH